MNSKFTQDEQIAKEEELFKLSPDKDQARIKELAMELKLDGYYNGGYIQANQYTDDGPPITLQQLLEVAAYWDEEEYFALLMQNDTSKIDFARVEKAAKVQGVGGEEVLSILEGMRGTKELVEGMHSPGWDSAYSSDEDVALGGLLYPSTDE